MAIEYKVRISESQRKLIMRALTAAMANNRRSSGEALNTTPDEWMELIGVFAVLNPQADDQPENCRHRRSCPHVRRSILIGR
jgi:hypothetical protein